MFKGYVKRKGLTAVRSTRAWARDFFMGLFSVVLQWVKGSTTILLSAGTIGYVGLFQPDIYLDFAEVMNSAWRTVVNVGRSYGGRNSWASTLLALVDFGGKGGYVLFLATIQGFWNVVFLVLKMFFKGVWLTVLWPPLRNLYYSFRRPRATVPAEIHTPQLPPPDAASPGPSRRRRMPGTR